MTKNEVFQKHFALEECYSICVKHATDDFFFELKRIRNSGKKPEIVEIYSRCPYIPFIPKDWNGVLVLGLAQNYAIRDKEEDEYGISLRNSEDKEGPEMSILRLYPGEFPQLGPGKGIGPWGDGFLPLAIESALPGCRSENCACSNAVLWSCTKNGGKADGRVMRNDPQIQTSIEVWSHMLKALGTAVKLIIAVSTITHFVVEKACRRAEIRAPQAKWRHPSSFRPRISKELFAGHAVDKTDKHIREMFRS